MMQTNQLQGSRVFQQMELQGHDIESSQVMPKSRKFTMKSGNSNQNFMDLLEESKKMLYDIKRLDDGQQE